jgi:hypothetical protein
MAGADVFLIPTTSLPPPLREQRWTPTPEMLRNLEAGKTEVKVLALELEEDGGGDLDSAHSVWATLDERDGTQFAGSITSSALDRDGFRVGDRLEAPLDRVFDFQVREEHGAGRLNEDRARFALGKRILVGITRVDPDGELIEQRQYVGELIHVDPNQGLELQLANGDHEWLPPDVRPLEEAPLGEYRLRSTGEVVEDPDYVCTWTITQNPDGGH